MVPRRRRRSNWSSVTGVAADIPPGFDLVGYVDLVVARPAAVDPVPDRAAIQHPDA
jgi:hypothetical protein